MGERTEQEIRIAMWSVPRTISTALMRSWESRDDTFVCDEPFYAHYLSVTDVDHPGRDEVISAHETDWRKVASWLTGDIPDGKSVFYQKHMAHHLLPDMDRDWLRNLTNVFLIREPEEMLTSLIRVTPEVSADDTGFPQQWELFEKLSSETDGTPPVIDSKEMLENPRAMLGRLCEEVGVPFSEAMLSWEPGGRDTDGVWAKYWYAAVEKSTGFQPYKPKNEAVPNNYQTLYEQCQDYYERLYERRIRV